MNKTFKVKKIFSLLLNDFFFWNLMIIQFREKWNLGLLLKIFRGEAWSMNIKERKYSQHSTTKLSVWAYAKNSITVLYLL